MPSQIAVGTQAATLGTEHTLHTETTAKVLVLVVDTVNLADDEFLDLAIYTKQETADTERLAYSASYAHAQGAPMKYSIPVPSLASWKATLKQTGGTGRNFKWQVLAL